MAKDVKPFLPHMHAPFLIQFTTKHLHSEWNTTSNVWL